MWDTLTSHPWMLWLIVALVLAGIEMLTLDFLFLMMATAALITAALSVVTDNFALHVVTFAAVSVALIFLVRPLALNRLNRSTPATLSNAQRLVGLPCTVEEEVNEHSGLVRLEGEIWTARTYPGEVLPESATVYVHAVRGATVVVGAMPAAPDERSRTI